MLKIPARSPKTVGYTQMVNGDAVEHIHYTRGSRFNIFASVYHTFGVHIRWHGGPASCYLLRAFTVQRSHTHIHFPHEQFPNNILNARNPVRWHIFCLLFFGNLLYGFAAAAVILGTLKRIQYSYYFSGQTLASESIEIY